MLVLACIVDVLVRAYGFADSSSDLSHLAVSRLSACASLDFTHVRVDAKREPCSNSGIWLEHLISSALGDAAHMCGSAYLKTSRLKNAHAVGGEPSCSYSE